MSYRYDMIDLIAALIGSLIVGGFLGLVPLICGLVKKRIGLAIGGFFACLGGGLLLGLILAVPMCVLFTVLIFVTKSKTAGMPTDSIRVRRPIKGRYGRMISRRCRHLSPLSRRKCLGRKHRRNKFLRQR